MQQRQFGDNKNGATNPKQEQTKKKLNKYQGRPTQNFRKKKDKGFVRDT